MAVCPVCGCKTDALDFVDSKIGSLDKSVCSFCHKQLNALSSSSAGEAQLNWLKAVLNKDVPEREPEVLSALKDLLALHGGSVEPAQQAGAAPYSAPANTPAKTKVYKANSGEVTEGDQPNVAELTERVEKLEKELRLMKRSMLIKTICEIALPIIMGIIILIVFFSSDFYGKMSYMFKSFMG